MYMYYSRKLESSLCCQMTSDLALIPTVTYIGHWWRQEMHPAETASTLSKK